MAREIRCEKCGLVLAEVEKGRIRKTKVYCEDCAAIQLDETDLSPEKGISENDAGLEMLRRMMGMR